MEAAETDPINILEAGEFNGEKAVIVIEQTSPGSDVWYLQEKGYEPGNHPRVSPKDIARVVDALTTNGRKIYNAIGVQGFGGNTSGMVFTTSVKSS